MYSLIDLHSVQYNTETRHLWKFEIGILIYEFWIEVCPNNQWIFVTIPTRKEKQCNELFDCVGIRYSSQIGSKECQRALLNNQTIIEYEFKHK